MGYVPVAQGRAQVQSVPGGIELLIPSRRNVLLVLFFCVWLVGWYFGEVTTVREILWPQARPAHAGDRPTLFLAFWLCGWTIGGAFVMFSVLWTLAGRERVTVTSDALTIRHEVFGIGRSKPYRLSAVHDLRVLDVVPTRPFGPRDGLGLSGGGPLVFDYGAKTIRFGAGVDAAEAKQLAAKVIAARPGLAPKDRS